MILLSIIFRPETDIETCSLVVPNGACVIVRRVNCAMLNLADRMVHCDIVFTSTPPVPGSHTQIWTGQSVHTRVSDVYDQTVGMVT